MKEREVKVLLEDLQSQFRVFGEGLQTVQRRLDAVYEMTAKNTESIVQMQDELRLMKAEMNGMKSETGLMRSHLLGKVDREEFTGLEKRVCVLEKRRN